MQEDLALRNTLFFLIGILLVFVVAVGTDLGAV